MFNLTEYKYVDNVCINVLHSPKTYHTGTRNQEPGTRNQEPGTRNQKPETSKAEQKDKTFSDKSHICIYIYKNKENTNSKAIFEKILEKKLRKEPARSTERLFEDLLSIKAWVALRLHKIKTKENVDTLCPKFYNAEIHRESYVEPVYKAKVD